MMISFVFHLEEMKSSRNPSNLSNMNHANHQHTGIKDECELLHHCSYARWLRSERLSATMKRTVPQFPFGENGANSKAHLTEALEDISSTDHNMQPWVRTQELQTTTRSCYWKKLLPLG